MFDFAAQNYKKNGRKTNFTRDFPYKGSIYCIFSKKNRGNRAHLQLKSPIILINFIRLKG